MLIPQSNTWEQGFRKRTVKNELKIGPVSLKFITIALIAVGALFYLAESSQSATQKYQIMQLNLQKQQLQDQSKDLQVQAARLQSLSNIQSSSESLGLVSSQ